MVVLAQIFRFSEQDAVFLRELTRSLLRLGIRLVLWSNRDLAIDGRHGIPLVRSSADELLILTDTAPLDSVHLEPWQRTVGKINAHYRHVEPAYEPQRCFRVARTVLKELQPDVFLCWNGYEPWFGMARDIAGELLIPTLCMGGRDAAEHHLGGEGGDTSSV